MNEELLEWENKILDEYLNLLYIEDNIILMEKEFIECYK